MANFCSKCGKPVNPDAAFCSNCGANLQSFEVSNSVVNDNTQNNSNNTNFYSNNATSNRAVNSLNNTASEQVINLNNVYQQISLSALLANLKEIPIGTKIRTGGCASKDGKGMIHDIALYVDIEELKRNGDNLFVNLDCISGKTRRKLSDNFSNATDGYLDITVEGQIKKVLMGNYLEAENLYFEQFVYDNTNQVSEQVESNNNQVRAIVNNSSNSIPNYNQNQQIVYLNQVSNKSTKSRFAAAFLQLFFGWIGLGRSYLGHHWIAFFQGLFSIGSIIIGFPIIAICICFWDFVDIIKDSNLKDGKNKIVD